MNVTSVDESVRARVRGPSARTWRRTVSDGTTQPRKDNRRRALDRDTLIKASRDPDTLIKASRDPDTLIKASRDPDTLIKVSRYLN